MSGPATILLVEDNPDDLMLLQRAFAKARIDVALHSVDNGDTAVAYLSGDGLYNDRTRYPLPAMVLLDLKLPRRSGLEVLAWLRQSKLRRLPVVVLTSSRDAGDINRAYDLGANSYLVKPVAFDRLTDLVSWVERYWMTLNEQPDVA